MLGRTNSISGGTEATELNFSIVGGTNPPTGTEGMIWVETENEITSWVFSSTQPESASDGMVWFQIGTSSSVAFSVLKNETIMVYPLICRQYSNGSWQQKSAHSYSESYPGDHWKPWRTYIFESGSWPITGWGNKLGGGSGNDLSSVTTEKVTLKLQSNTEYGKSIVMYYTEAEHIPANSTLYFDVGTTSKTNGGLSCKLFSSAPSSIDTQAVLASSTEHSNIPINTTLQIPVAQGSDYIIGFSAQIAGYDTDDIGYIYNVYYI